MALGDFGEPYVGFEDGAREDDRLAEILLRGAELAALEIAEPDIVVDLFAMGIGGVTEDRHEVDLGEMVLARGEIGGAPVVSCVGETRHQPEGLIEGPQSRVEVTQAHLAQADHVENGRVAGCDAAPLRGIVRASSTRPCCIRTEPWRMRVKE